MGKTFERVEELAGTIKEYVNIKIDEAKLKTAEKCSAVLANVIAGIIVAGVLLFFIIFASIALSLGLGEWLGKAWLGFLIVAGLYLIMGVIVWSAREKIIRMPVINAMISQLFTKEEDEENEKG